MSSDPEPEPTTAPPTPRVPAAVPEPVARRNFLHGLSRDALGAAARAAGMAADLQRTTGEAIGAALGVSAGDPARPAEDLAVQPAPAPPAAWPVGVTPRPYRLDGATLWLLDLQRYPAAIAEVACSTTGEIAAAMIARRVAAASVLGELAGYAMWMAVVAARGSAPPVRRTRLRTTAAALRAARPNVASLDHATRWMVEAWDRAAATSDDDAVLEAACLAAADALAARHDHDRVASAARAADHVPDPVGRPVRLLTLGGEGVPDAAVGGGAAGVAAALAAAGRGVEVTVLESRPDDAAARLTGWVLASAGIPTTLAADAAAGHLLSAGEVDAVVVGADRLGPDGGVTATVGTYPLAVLAGRSGVPFLIVASSAAIEADPDAGPSAARAEKRPALDPARPTGIVLSVRPGARGPLQDVTPAALVTAVVTEDGPLDWPTGRSRA